MSFQELLFELWRLRHDILTFFSHTNVQAMLATEIDSAYTHILSINHQATVTLMIVESQGVPSNQSAASNAAGR